MESNMKRLDAYIKVLDELAMKDVLYKPIINRLESGFKEGIKDFNNIYEELKSNLKEAELNIREKIIDIKKLEGDLRDIERNEDENRI